MLRHFSRSFAVHVALLTGLAWTLPATAQASSSRAATVVHLRGNARYSSDNKTWRPIKSGIHLNSGAVIQTADKSSLDIELPGGDTNSVHLFANSVLAMDQLTSDNSGNDQAMDIELNLQAGEIAGIVGKLSAAAKYEINFATGVAGVRGGAYRISAAGLVEVSTGQVIVATMTQDAPIKVVTAGQRFNSATGLATEIPSGYGAALPVAPAKSNPAPTPILNSPSTPPAKAPGLSGALRKF